jgi:hypothetical protein
MSFDGLDTCAMQESTTVIIPKINLFNAETLTQMMIKISKGARHIDSHLVKWARCHFRRQEHQSLLTGATSTEVY